MERESLSTATAMASLFEQLFCVDGGNIKQSIQRHLSLLFNTHKGSVPYDLNYGMPDLLEHYKHLPQAGYLIKEAMLFLIKHYEPRVLANEIHITIITREDGLPSFKLNLTVKSQEEQFQYMANFKPQGQCELIEYG